MTAHPIEVDSRVVCARALRPQSACLSATRGTRSPTARQASHHVNTDTTGIIKSGTELHVVTVNLKRIRDCSITAFVCSLSQELKARSQQQHETVKWVRHYIHLTPASWLLRDHQKLRFLFLVSCTTLVPAPTRLMSVTSITVRRQQSLGSRWTSPSHAVSHAHAGLCKPLA